MRELPPFPEDLPTAPISNISFAKILAKDAAEAKKVLEACRTHGFLYLDLQSCPEGQALVKESELLLKIAKGFFTSPLEEKRKFALVKGRSLAGYKEAGSIKKTDQDKRPDATEFLSIFKDHMLGIMPSRNYPDDIMAAKSLIEAFNENAHACAMTILDTLARQLGIHQNEFTDRHNFNSPSGDHLRITRTLPNKNESDAVGLASHTDFGSVTVLFNWLGGLQIQSRDPNRNGEWDFVKPIRGHAIINLGDAMVVFTNGELKSAKHRVVPAPGKQAAVDRYSLVYFVRPADDVIMKPIDSCDTSNGPVQVAGKLQVEKDEVYNAAQWMIKRAVQMGA